MTYSIVTSSKTGNTQAVADAIAAALPPEGCVYRGAPAPEALDADVIFAGFWTDKGTCAQDMAGFLPLCGGKKVALFGTAGFGGDPDYFNMLLENVKKLLPSDAVYLGGWMCQGRMPGCAPALPRNWSRTRKTPTQNACWKISTARCLIRTKRTSPPPYFLAMGSLLGTPLRLNPCKQACRAALLTMGSLLGETIAAESL